jgi:PE family
VDGAVGHSWIIAELAIGHSGLHPAILPATTPHGALGCRRFQRRSKTAAALDQSTRAWIPLAPSGYSDGAQPSPISARAEGRAPRTVTRMRHLPKGKPMSGGTPQPQALAAAVAQLAGQVSAMNAKNSAAAAPTAGLVPAAADDVSALMAARFAVQAQIYQAVSAQAAAFHELFVSALTASDGSRAATDATDTAATD